MSLCAADVVAFNGNCNDGDGGGFDDNGGVRDP